MIRITDTPKPRDRFGSIPIRESKPMNSSSAWAASAPAAKEIFPLDLA